MSRPTYPQSLHPFVPVISVKLEGVKSQKDRTRTKKPSWVLNRGLVSWIIRSLENESSESSLVWRESWGGGGELGNEGRDLGDTKGNWTECFLFSLQLTFPTHMISLAHRSLKCQQHLLVLLKHCYMRTFRQLATLMLFGHTPKFTIIHLHCPRKVWK